MPIESKRFKCQEGKNQEAVQVAADALWRLSQGFMSASVHSGYVDGADRGARVLHDKADLEQCRVCALGALLVGRALHGSDADWNRCIAAAHGNFTWIDGEAIWPALSDIFPGLMLQEIEQAFELWSGWGLYYGHLSPQERAATIMRNIIANDGDFVCHKEQYAHIHAELRDGRVVVVRRSAVAQ